MDKEKAIKWLKIIGRDVITLDEPYRTEAVEAIAVAIAAIRQQVAAGAERESNERTMDKREKRTSGKDN